MWERVRLSRELKSMWIRPSSGCGTLALRLQKGADRSLHTRDDCLVAKGRRRFVVGRFVVGRRRFQVVSPMGASWCDAGMARHRSVLQRRAGRDEVIQWARQSLCYGNGKRMEECGLANEGVYISGTLRLPIASDWLDSWCATISVRLPSDQSLRHSTDLGIHRDRVWAIRLETSSPPLWGQARASHAPRARCEGRPRKPPPPIPTSQLHQIWPDVFRYPHGIMVLQVGHCWLLKADAGTGKE